MITTALNLPTAIEKRSKEMEHSGLVYSELLDKIMEFDFSSSIKHQHASQSNPFIKYLKENGCLSAAGFLEQYSK